MIVDTKGQIVKGGRIDGIVEYLNQLSDSVRFIYKGLTVEIDPTVDYISQNVLVRWLDVREGFNDRIIIYSLVEFKNNFTEINNV